MTRPRVLIEDWLPIEEIGAESRRENSTGLHPAPNRLHVWWARRPLIASRTALLASVLPSWSADFPEDLKEKFPNSKAYHKWFLELCGIYGDPVQAQKLIFWAKEHKKKIPNPYTSERAYKVNPTSEQLHVFRKLLEYTWKTTDINMLDPFAGGGSIPLEAIRYGFETYANDLNPVAAVILKATIDIPLEFGYSLVDDIRKWATRWYELVKPKLQPYFTPLSGDSEGAAFLWARTIQWQGKTIPLSPNWWLQKKSTPVAVRVITDPDENIPRFEILTGASAVACNPDVGTVNHGIARSPWTGETIDRDYIKNEALSGRMREICYAIAIKKPGGMIFRAPTSEDIVLSQLATRELIEKKQYWLSRENLPSEIIPDGNKTAELKRHGPVYWIDVFTPRQLLVMGFLQETLAEIEKEIVSTVNSEKAKAIMIFLGIIFDKVLSMNSRQSRWDCTRVKVNNLFERHDFAYKWSFGEFDAAGNLLPWCVDQVIDAYTEISELLNSQQQSLVDNRLRNNSNKPKIFCRSANDLLLLEDESIINVTADPPYYDNVQYAELSDFFYVWLKRSVGDFFPEFFATELTNKDDEAVANPTRFASMGHKKKNLAEQDYERKMISCFREIYRVLNPVGVLTVMFTHKKVEAWDTLASAIIGSGFEIDASWPVHTESEHSLHQAKKNSASSTIMLVCRKRDQLETEPVWWDDIKIKVRDEARQKAQEFAEMGIHGVDLYISTFGPTLSIISKQWPVLTSEVDPKTGKPKELRPEVALDLAREEVVRMRKQGLLLGRDVEFDPVTDWYLMAWDAFKAEEFPYDEARKLAIALGIELDQEIMSRKRIVSKKGDYVMMLTPVQRRKKDMVDDEITSFPCVLDLVHTAMMVYQEDGAGACDAFMMKAGVKNDARFKSCLQSMINAIPRSKIKGKFVRSEAGVLDGMRLSFFEELTVPVEDEPELPTAVQTSLFDEVDTTEDEDVDND